MDVIACPECGWTGRIEQCIWVEEHECCPTCAAVLLIDEPTDAPLIVLASEFDPAATK